MGSPLYLTIMAGPVEAITYVHLPLQNRPGLS